MGKFKSMLTGKMDDLVDEYEHLLARELTMPEMIKLQKIENTAMEKLIYSQPSVGNPQLERIKQKIIDEAVAQAKTYLESLIPISRNVVIRNPDGSIALGEPYEPSREPLPRGWGMPLELYPHPMRPAEGSSMPRTPAEPLLGRGGAGRSRVRDILRPTGGAGTGL